MGLKEMLSTFLQHQPAYLTFRNLFRLSLHFQKATKGTGSKMARRKRAEALPEGGPESEAAARPDTTTIAQYRHTDKQRVNNPPVGLVTPDTDKDR
jgi:hypothetical protein